MIKIVGLVISWAYSVSAAPVSLMRNRCCYFFKPKLKSEIFLDSRTTWSVIII